MKQPNIMIIMSDQHRADIRKGEGYPLDTMPFLDEWSQECVDFRKAYTPNPTCLPARVSMFTGRYPSCHRARTNHNGADAYYTEDLLDVMKKAGYVTALCGKNHTHRPLKSFDFFEANLHGGFVDGYECTAAEKKLDDFMKSLAHMESRTPSPGTVKEQQPYRNVTSAFKFIDSLKKDRPFFAGVSFAEPHNPFQVPEPYFDLFPPECLPEPVGKAENLINKDYRLQWLREQWKIILGEHNEERIARTRSNYYGMLRLIDDQLRRLIKGLKERGIYDNTIIIYLSDHGDFAGEFGLIRKGGDLEEVLVRVPMIWHVPSMPAQGIRKDCYVNIVDILPTLCDLIGAEVPFGVQGKSLRPLLEGGEFNYREFDTAYSESGFSGLYWNEKDALTLEDEGAYDKGCTFDCLDSWTQAGQVRMIRKGRYKLQMDMMGTGFLYDLEKDPHELTNLWDKEEYGKVQSEMLKVLISETLKASDPLPAPRNRYRTKIHPKGYWYDEDFCAKDPGIRIFGRP